MKNKTLIIILSLVLLMSCEKEPRPNTLSYDFGQVSAKPQTTSCLISCVNERVDNIRVRARVLISEAEDLQEVEAFPLQGNGSLLTCNITGLEEGTIYYYTFELFSGVDCCRDNNTYQFTTKFDAGITVTTAQITEIGITTAMGGGNVTVDEGVLVTERGLCWGTNSNPTIQGTHLACGQGEGSFTVEMTDLMSYTGYYVRAYAINSADTIYGNQRAFTTLFTNGIDAPTGAINGLFSVNATQQVFFSQGNLQYQASTGTWRFAENQYDFVGDDNSNLSSSYRGWIDLFGWGTSGIDHGATYYLPWSVGSNSGGFSAYGNYNANLYDQTGQADWGYNPISNGGDAINIWRTLTTEEWAYVLNTRNTPSGIRFAKAQVNNVNGVILLPDNWNSSFCSLNSTNASNASYSRNIISSTKWRDDLEVFGAVFLPASGYRFVTTMYQVNSNGGYWSSTCSHQGAYYMYFSDSYLNAKADGGREYGRSVRLVTHFNMK